MKTLADKSSEPQRQAAAHQAPQQQDNSDAELQFIDNRAETVSLRQLQEAADNSPQVQGLAQLSTMMNNSTRSGAIRTLQAMVDNSPRRASMVSQAESGNALVQRVEEDELLQGEFAAESPAQLAQPSEDKPNNTGLPDKLKAGVESLSGLSLDNVKVHYNSPEPAQLNAHAYAQGTDIHVGPGKEQHLPHEAWHVVQQAQGRVKPTMQMKDGVGVNDDQGLEGEADSIDTKKDIYPFNAINPIQRAIKLHEVENINNQMGIANNIRKAWFIGLVKNEMARIINESRKGQSGAALSTPATLGADVAALKQANHNAFSVVKWELNPFLKGIKSNIPVTKDDFLSVNDFLNRAEVFLKTKKKAPDIIKDVLVGNEFTFTHSSLTSLTPDAEDDDDIYRLMKKPYNVLAGAWKTAMNVHNIAPAEESTDSFGMIYLTYEFKSITHGIDWSYKVTPDHMCLEIITAPAKAGEVYAGHIGDFMDTYIFDIAQQANVKADANIGGGHINIDEKSAFGAYSSEDVDDTRAHQAAEVLAKFIQEFFNDEGYWQSLDPDATNAAFPSETGKASDFVGLIKRFNSSGWDVETLAENLIKSVFDHALANVSSREYPHYQALNVEHLKDSEEDETRRLEVRRVPAQVNLQALISELDKIAGYLTTAKS